VPFQILANGGHISSPLATLWSRGVAEDLQSHFQPYEIVDRRQQAQLAAGEDYDWLVELLKVQRNELYDAIIAGGVNPDECRLDSYKTKRFDAPRSRVTHLPSGSSFEFRDSGRGGELSGTYDILKGGFDNALVRWEGVVNAAKAWAQEIVQPDFWISPPRNQEWFTSARYEDLTNTLFTAGERLEISNQLQEIKEDVREKYSLSDEQMSRVEAGLTEAVKASERIGRKDWLLLFSGTLFTLIMTDFITPEVAQHVLMIALHGLSHLFRGEARPVEGRVK
jgi:hypothetical protein